MKFLIVILALLLCTSCAAIPNQIRPPSEYRDVVYNSSQAAIVTEEEALDFLERDQTDRNVWIAGKYECTELACDLWWNAYMQGIEACLVPVKQVSRGHVIVNIHTTDGWLWVEPHSDITSYECWYTILGTSCGQEAFNACTSLWNAYNSIYE